MKRHITKFASLLSICVLCLLSLPASAQQWPVTQPSGSNSYENGVFYAPNFGQWSLKLASAMTGGVTTTFLTNKGFVSTPDGFVFSPFAVGEKIQIGSATSGLDILTITAVSNCNLTALDGQTPICSVTVSAAPANTHNTAEPIVSADSGIMEAIGYAQNAVGSFTDGVAQSGGGTGGAQVYFAVDCGITTLSTGGATTTTTCFVPNQFFNQGSASRVSTTITTSTSWAVGVIGSTTAFSTAQATLTAGTTAFTVQGTPAVVLATGATTPGLTALLYTMGTSAPGAGAIKSKVWGYVAVQPAF
jgi:hypothetical protein